jgi:hypothetical protein
MILKIDNDGGHDESPEKSLSGAGAAGLAAGERLAVCGVRDSLNRDRGGMDGDYCRTWFDLFW